MFIRSPAKYRQAPPLGRSLAQVPDGDQLLVDDGVHLAAVPEVALQQEAVAAGLQDWGSQGGSWG